MPEGGFNVLIPAIPEICTYGETLEEAREMARDAIRCYLESAAEDRRADYPSIWSITAFSFGTSSVTTFHTIPRSTPR
jgi:hypothetical protein